MDNGASSYRRFREENDELGLVEIINGYKDGLIFFVNSIVGDIYAAEDIAIDVFALLGVKKPRFDGKNSFKTWLYAIAKNRAFDHLRKASRFKESPLDEYRELKGEEGDFVSLFIKDERNRALYRAIAKLKPEHRPILHLIYFEGYGHKEASAVIGKSVHATEALASRARKALKQQLIKEDFEYEE